MALRFKDAPVGFLSLCLTGQIVLKLSPLPEREGNAVLVSGEGLGTVISVREYVTVNVFVASFAYDDATNSTAVLLAAEKT